jgi:hypothetical protein
MGWLRRLPRGSYREAVLSNAWYVVHNILPASASFTAHGGGGCRRRCGRRTWQATSCSSTSELKFFGDHAALAEAQAFAAYLAPLRQAEWVVYAKKPFGGPQAVLAYLARYTHRVAIANSRLIACDHNGVTFKWKDYRIEGPERFKTMTLATGEFIRRFLSHVLPDGFHRIRQLSE